jgi:hypothetical protein
MNIPDVLVSFWVGLVIAGIIAIITFGAVSCDAHMNSEEMCVQKGGDWVLVSDKDNDYAEYGCKLN